MRPVPVPQPESDFYWRKANEGELWLRRCRTCRQTYFYPRDICPACFSRDTEWIRASGQATLYSYAIVHRPPGEAWRDEVPYVVAIVELEEGARMPTNLVGVEPDPASIRIGAPVTLSFKRLSEKIAIPVFSPRVSE
jgi:uncharacterized OB-fold protein